MQTSNENTLLQISIPSHRQDIIQAFKGLVEAFRGDVQLENKPKQKESQKSILDYAGSFSGAFSENISYKTIRKNRVNKI